VRWSFVSTGQTQLSAWMSRVPWHRECGSMLGMDAGTINSALPSALTLQQLSTHPVKAQESTVSTPSELRSAQLLEQLMQIARASALEEMASGMAHELNQPLGAIATFAQAAQRLLSQGDPKLQDVAEILAHIATQALQAGQGIHRIRNRFNGREVTRTTCTLAEVVDELQPVLELLTRRVGARLIVESPAGLPAVSIDRLRIQHVLFTLTQNALEAVHANGVTPTITIQLSGDRYSVQVAVLDTGSGIAKTTQAQLFRPFFTTKQGGTGLGLASSRAIIEAHEGTIGFDDTNKGARFWFKLPALAATP
jgi:signal transduction histidine kinase